MTRLEATISMTQRALDCMERVEARNDVDLDLLQAIANIEAVKEQLRLMHQTLHSVKPARLA